MKITEKEAIVLLKKYSKNKKQFLKVYTHSKAVQRLASRLAKKIKNIDIKFVKTTSLLHDIGRFSCPPDTKKSIRHGLIGAKILRKEKLWKIANVAERHIGVGITKADIKKQKLDLPLKNFVPKTIEEKIIAHADNFIFGSKEKRLKDVVKRFRKELGDDYVKRILKLDKELKKLMR